MAAADAMTRRKGKSYVDFVDGAARNPIARTVKIADLRDNLDMTRIAEPTRSDLQRSHVRRRMIWNRRPEFGLEGSGSVG